MTKDQAIDKIRKLLRMQRGGTPHEIETALALAAELARKHNVDMAGVDPDHEPDQAIGHIDATTSARLGWECKYAALVVQGFFNVNALITKNWQGPKWYRFRKSAVWRIRLIGTAWDTQIALYVYEFLIKHMRRLWAAGPLSPRGARLRNRQAFLYGMYIGLCSKLDEQKEKQFVPEAGLVLVERGLARRDAYVKKEFGETGKVETTPDTDATAAKNAGFNAGMATNIRSGLSPAARNVPQLLNS
jgi:hypothetical protein